MIRIDLALPLTTFVILAFGLLTLSTAAPSNELIRQLVFLGAGIAASAVILWLGRRRLLRFSMHLYIATMGLLVLTKLIGATINGAKSWLILGPLPGFQPSELSKIALILALASVFHERPVQGPMSYLRPVVLIALPVGLVFLEPDLGSALVLAAVGVGIFMIRGIPWRHLVVFGTLFLVAVPTIVWPNLEPHQKERMVSFLNPAADPQGSGYQVIQSTIAVGSGGLFGKGYGRGTQSQFGFIPYRHTDFIFPVLAEEGGFAAASVLLLLYGLLFWRLASMAMECIFQRDQFIVAGVLVLIGFQVLVNVGVTLGLAPVTGITLPLVSYGGTSLIATLLGLTLAYVVHRDRYADR